MAHLGKPIENRSWKCPLNPGDYLAIHAGKQWDAKQAAWIEEKFQVSIGPDNQHPTGVVAVVRFVGNVQASESPWFFGPWGWVMEDPVAIAPVPCGGMQRLWTMSDPVLSAVWANFKEAQNS